jgi:hypothetical protein
MFRSYKCVDFELVGFEFNSCFDDWDGSLKKKCSNRCDFYLYTHESIIIPKGYVGLLNPSVEFHKLSYLGFDLSKVNYISPGERIISYVFPIPDISIGFGRLRDSGFLNYHDKFKDRLNKVGFFDVFLLDLLVFPSL